jgi:hypothetical protein
MKYKNLEGYRILIVRREGLTRVVAPVWLVPERLIPKYSTLN